MTEQEIRDHISNIIKTSKEDNPEAAIASASDCCGSGARAVMSVTQFPALPFIALGVPCGRAEICMGTTRSIWATARSYRGQMAFIHGDSSIVSKSRSMIVEGAMKIKAEYIFFVDSDMSFPPETLSRLLAADRDIVAVPYLKRTPPYESLAVPLDGPGDYSGLIEVECMALGLCLIRTSVFASIPQPYFRFETDEARGLTLGEDVVFCKMARERGFRIWADTDLALKTGHIGTIVVTPGAEGTARLAVNA